MEDEKIIGLYFERSESAIQETQRKYEKYCYHIAYHILYSDDDTQDCLNDTYLNLWNNIPPQRPNNLKSFVGKIVRNLALNRYSYNNAQKRKSTFDVALDELQYCLPSNEFAIDDEVALKEILNKFIRSLSKKNRIIFLQRYWYFCPIKDIANNLGITENNVKIILYRVREQFKIYLKKEGVII